MNTKHVILCTLIAILPLGCSRSSDDGGSSASSAPADANAIPAGVFRDAPPEEYGSLRGAKQAANIGDRVQFEARIGGRLEPFVTGRAVMILTDSSLKSCRELHDDDTCATPWDYCCEPRESLVANTATVQVVDAAGSPLRTSLEGTRGLEPLATVIVLGTVAQKDDAGTFVVNADGLYVMAEQ